MEESDNIITELSLCGYVVKEELIPWVDYLHFRITVEDPQNKEHRLDIAENITDVMFRQSVLQRISVSREILMRKITNEIKKRKWPMKRRVLGNWGIDK